MAELLIMAFDTLNLDPERDLNAWKAGHVVAVMPDGHQWGKRECPPRFWRVKLPGVPVKDAQKFMETKIGFTVDFEPVQAGIRKYKLDVNDMPVPIKDALLKSGEVEISGKDAQATIDRLMKVV